MRLFFALHPPKEARLALSRLLGKYLQGNGRHTHPEDLHMTLQFLGAVDAQQLDCIKSAAESIHMPRFDLVIDRLDYWPRPKIMWAGPSAFPEALGKLVETLGEALGECGFTPAPEPYRPHVTLARKAHRLSPTTCEPVTWPVDEFVLFEAVPGHRPNRYCPVMKIKLENE